MTEQRGRFNYSIYITGLATVFCGLAAVNSVLNDNRLIMLTGILLCIGYSTSMGLRWMGYTARLIELVVIAAALAIYIQLVGGYATSEWMVPSMALETPELRLAIMLLWLEVLRSFTLVSDESVVFSAVPSVVLISLVATNNINPEIMAFLIIYLVLTTFLLVHRPGVTQFEPKAGFRIALVVAVIALVIGLAVVIPIRLVCVKAFAAAMPEFTRIRDRLALPSFGDSNSIQIARGPVHLSDETIMTVRSHLLATGKSMGTYWRGSVFDRYTGHGWTNTAEYVEMEGRVISDLADDEDEQWYEYGNKPGSEERLLDQVIVSRPTLTREVFAAATPVWVQAPYRRLYINEFGCFRGIFGRNGIAEYRVVSRLPVNNRARLRAAGSSYPRDIKDRFLGTLISTPKVKGLAEHVTRGFDNPYDKAVAIQQYLGREYTYDLNAPPTPPNNDAVEYFLFTSHVGYCDVFASAMVIMCREVGVPARLATGFSTGIYDSKRDRFRVRDMDRHAWAEVFFPGCGWVAFDPTESTLTAQQDWLQQLSNNARRLIGELLGGTSVLPTTVILLTVCAAVAFGSEIRKIRIRFGSKAPTRLHAAAVARYLDIRRRLGTTAPNLTPFESVLEADSTSNEARDIALRAARLFAEIRYGNREINNEDIKYLDQLRRELKIALKKSVRCKVESDEE